MTIKKIKVNSSLVTRFWYYVVKGTTPEDCWSWRGAKDAFGYSVLNASWPLRTVYKASRVSWTIHNGEIPDDLFVLHKCKSKSCINPEHIYLGNSEQNMHDALYRDETFSEGESHYNSKFTDEQHIEMLALAKQGYSSITLAKKYCLNKNYVDALLRGVWRKKQFKKFHGVVKQDSFDKESATIVQGHERATKLEGHREQNEQTNNSN